MTNEQKIRFPGTVLLLTAIVVLVAVVWIFFGNRPDRQIDRQPENQPGAANLSQDEIIRLIALKNLGLGLLENIPNLKTGRLQAIDECVKIFTELSEQLPGEPLGPQNLAIARLIIFLNHKNIENREEVSRDYQNAITALQKFEQAQGETFLVHILRAKLAGKAVALKWTADYQQIIDEYDLASKLDPDNPLPWTELYLAAATSSSQEMRAKILEALKKSHPLLPENYALLIELLYYQIREKDPSLVETLEVAEEKLRLFKNTFLRDRIDLSKSIADAKQALRSDAPDKWEIVSSRISGIVNLVRPETAYQLDRRRLEKYPLEFIIFDFSEEFYAEANLPQSDSPPSVKVKFVKATGGQQLPELDDVVDAIFADFNLDGRPDVIVLRKETIQVFSFNRGDEGPQLLTEVDIPPGMEHILVADLDWDYRENRTPTTAPQTADEGKQHNKAPLEQPEADLDLIVYGPGGARLLKNVLDHQTKNRTLEIVPQKAGIDDLQEVLAAGVVDFDHEGDLDLIFSSSDGISLWSNTGNFRFVNLSDRSLLPPADWKVTAILPVDWDQNVTTDILLCGPGANQAGYLENNFHSRFRLRTFEKGFDHLKGARSLALVDADANASWDVLSSGVEGISLTLTRISESGVVQPHHSLKLTDKPAGGLRTVDFDNDGLLDFLAWESDGGMSAFRGSPENFFVLTEGLFDESPQNVQACDVGDIDGDGDEDLLVVESGNAVVYHNDGGNKNSWINMTLSAESAPKEPSQRTNLHGIGSLLELKVGKNYQRRLVTRRTTHFGLGQQKQADIIRVLFPNGVPQNVIQPESRQ
ncbi:MAG: VCBS repeat-containing protein, partial [Planctomycetes bacterium]|nr:VCBS repeat-containing protein [Planctomycetota bacterium]